MTSRKKHVVLSVVLGLSLCVIVRAQPQKSVTEWNNQHNDPSPGMREQAVDTLGDPGAADEQVIAPLAKRIKAGAWWGRMDAVNALQRLANGSYSSPAVDALINGLRDRDPVSVPFAILKALESINLADRVAKRRAMVAAPRAQINAVRSLQRTANGSYSSAAVDGLIDMLKDPKQESVRTTIIDALERIAVLDEHGRMPRAGWFGVFPCSGWNYSQEFTQPFVSADRRSYGQDFAVNWMGNHQGTFFYRLARSPEIARSEDAQTLLLERCPFSTSGNKSLEGIIKLPDKSLNGWVWLDHTKTHYCQVTKLSEDSFWTVDLFVDAPIVGGADVDAVLAKHRAQAMKSPPRTDFRPGLEEFEVLTKGAKVCEVELWAGNPFPNTQVTQPDGTLKIAYDLPDTSQVLLTFKPDSQDASPEKTLPGLVAVQHVSKDPSGKDMVEEISLK